MVGLKVSPSIARRFRARCKSVQKGLKNGQKRAF
jgi:hypothetical protein